MTPRTLRGRTTLLALLVALPVAARCRGEEANGGGDEKRTNRLAGESSPYLLQHATNPVDWYPWGPEAFERAKAEDRLVFLSIGYSTCHWCHVMEEESFENERIAKVLNERFVAVKVDREERPDVDEIYMTAVTAISGRGGWPLTVFLAPDGRPIWGTTYIPPEPRGRMPGLENVLVEISDLWKNDRERALSGAEELARAVKDRSDRDAGERAQIGEEALAALFDALEGSFDAVYGGFGSAPKFPRPHEIVAALAHSQRIGRIGRTENPRGIEMAELTLDRMAAGGIHDHLGGGFHRYSTDAVWLVPHFEKMLYDQALLVWASIEAYRATGHARHLATAEDILGYVRRDMTSPEGAFYSAEDADSEGKEGTFYVWRFDEIRGLLSEQEFALAEIHFGLAKEGNFADLMRHERGIPEGTNILHAAVDLSEAATRLGLSEADAGRLLGSAKEKLLAARGERPRPHKDDKVLAGWNGLMISAFALGHQATGKRAYLEAAQGAANFVLDSMTENGRLLRRHRKGASGIPGYLEDYAMVALGLVDLYEASFDVRWLREAIRLIDEIERLFHDSDRGGYFLSGSDAEELLARSKELYDGAIPSGNSVTAVVQGRLARMTGRADLEERFAATIGAFATRAGDGPISFPYFLRAVDFAIGPTYEVVLAGAADEPLLQMKRRIQTGFHPRLVLLHHPPGAAGQEIEKIAPFLAGQEPVDGKATAYVCQNFACKAPVTEVDALMRELTRE